MTKFFNWGFGIAVSLVVFAIFLVVLLVVFSFKRFDLVSEDYYDREIKFQEQIDKKKRADALVENLKLVKDGLSYKLVFPQEFHYNSISGDVRFYRADNAKKDFLLPLAIDTSNTMVLPSAGMDAGLWKIIVVWQVDEESYYFEEKVII